MRCLVDNNVPRSVTLLLLDRGHDAVEVRAVLGQDAPDDVVAAYAGAQGLIVVTHDRGLARRSARSTIPHLWLRTREPQDRERLEATIEEIAQAFAVGAIRIVLFASMVRVDSVR